MREEKKKKKTRKNRRNHGSIRFYINSYEKLWRRSKS